MGCASGPRGVDVARARALREEGDQAYQRREYADAVERYTESIQSNPDFAETYYWRGNAWSALPEQDPKANTRECQMKAIADYSAAIAKNPAHYDAYWNRGVVAAYFKQYASAIKDFLQCTMIRQTEAEPHLRIGELYDTRFEDMSLRAMEHYEHYVRLGGTNDAIIAKVKAWQEIKKQVQAPPPSQKGPTPEEEEKAKELHAKLTGLVGQGKSDDAFAAVDDLLTKFGHTKYVRDRLSAFTAMHKALKPADKK